MGRTLTYYVLTSDSWIYGDSGTRITDTSGNQLILATNEFPIKMTISGKIARAASIDGPGTVYLCTNDGSNTYAASPSFYIVSSSGGGTTMTHASPAWQTFIGGSLKGQPLAVCASNGGYTHPNRWEVIIYTHYTISAPATVTAPSSATDVFNLTWDASTPNDGTISHYEIQARDRTSNGAWSNWFTLNISTSTWMPVSPNSSAASAQRQYRVRAVGTDEAYSSDWVTSSAVTFLTGVPQTVIRYEIIKAATGKTYEI